MGLWEYLQSATDALKQSSLGAASITDACRTSYHHSTSAAGMAAAGGEKACSLVQSAAGTIAATAGAGDEKACNLVQSAAGTISGTAAAGREKACNIAQSAAGTIAATAAAGGEKACNLVQSTAADAARLGSSSAGLIKGAYSHAWNYTWWAATAADRAVRVDAPQWIAERVPEAERREQMVRVLKVVADAAISEGARCVPGGPPLYRVIRKGVAEIAEIQRESAAGASLRPSEAGHVDGAAAAGGTHRPEDVIGWFLREGFKGRELLDALVVPVPRGKRLGGLPAGTSESDSGN